ncbi:MAG TPA: LiaF-related protein [Bacteroidales bacterium]|nr:cell wall-active antibiotics response protein [Bacteroidales bacterium]HQK36589.1 LiaF-related protein [Bacteroidales bacterium]
MKMSAGLFWGILFILIGISIVIRVVFNVDFPLFKFLFAFLFIWIGIRIMLGTNVLSSHSEGEHNVIFGEKRWTGTEVGSGEYNIIFGKGVFDLRDMKPEGLEPLMVQVHTVFGGTEIKVSKDIPLRVEANAVFGGAEMPNGNNAAFGSVQYESPAFVKDSAHLFIKADVVFGGLQIKEY